MFYDPVIFNIYSLEIMTLSYVIAIGVGVYWISLALIGYYVVKKAFKTYRDHPKFDVPEHYQSLMRKDFNKWN